MRPADALSLYRRTRDRLVEEQGAEPGPALAGLHQHILRRDPALEYRPRADAAAPPARRALPGRTAGDAQDRMDVPAGLTLDSEADAAADQASSTIAAAFEAAYEGLRSRHQVFLRRIGLSPGPRVTVEVAAALADVSLAEASTTLNTLLDHGLLAPGPDSQMNFVDVFRELSAVRAAQDDSVEDRRQAVGRLLDYYLTASDQACAVLFPLRHRMPAPSTCPPGILPALATAGQARAWLESEWRNVLQAARYAASHRWPRWCADLVYLLTGWMEAGGYWDEAITASTLAMQACQDLGDPARTARAALDLAAISQQAGLARQRPWPGRKRRRDLPVPGGPAGPGPGSGPGRPGPPAHRPRSGSPCLLQRGQVPV